MPRVRRAARARRAGALLRHARAALAGPVTALRTREVSGALSPATARLLQRMVGPLCGLDQGLGFVTRGRYEPRLVVSGAELTGVHVLLGQAEAGSYHIGGAGGFPQEAVLRALREAGERDCPPGSLLGG